MSDEALIQTMERECDRFLECGRIGLGAEGHRLLLSLRHAIEDDRVIRMRVAHRSASSDNRSTETLDDVTIALIATVLRERRLAVQLWLESAASVKDEEAPVQGPQVV